MLGWIVTGLLRAEERSFPSIASGVRLEDVSPNVAVFTSSVRPSRVADQWNFEVTVSNRADRAIRGPIAVVFESLKGSAGVVEPSGIDGSGKPFFEISAQLLNGGLPAHGMSKPRTVAVRALAGAAPVVETRVYAARSPVQGAARVRTLNEVGQPLGAVTVEVVGATAPLQTDASYALASLVGGGQKVMRFSRDGYLPVWRSRAFDENAIGEIPSPRLVPRDTHPVTLRPVDGGTMERDGLTVVIAPGAINSEATLTVTRLTGQTLPSLLPLGWSPLGAFWLECSQPLTVGPRISLVPAGPIAPGETAAWVRWNTDLLVWEVVWTAAGDGTGAVPATLPGAGAYALVVGDAAPNAPPTAVLGESLRGLNLALPPTETLAASGKLDPVSSPASVNPELVTSMATVTVSNRLGNLPSGLLFRCEVTESYRLRDGGRRRTPQYEHFIVGYQRPGDSLASTVAAAFPVRPLRLLAGDDLDEALVHVDVLPPGTLTDTVLTAGGGQVAAGPLRVVAGAGDLSGEQVVGLRRIDGAAFDGLLPPGVIQAEAFDLAIGTVAPGRRLTLGYDGVSPPGSLWVLARAIFENGVSGLEPVERLRSDPSGNLVSLESAGDAPFRLPGLIGPGQYLLMRVPRAFALVTGATRDAAGNPMAGMLMRLGVWTTFSQSPDGRFQLIAEAGNFRVTAADLVRHDTAVADGTVGATLDAVALDVRVGAQGPVVSTVVPAPDATSVSRVTSVTVNFSRPIRAGTLVADGFRLLEPGGLAVAGALTLNLAGTSATFLPTTPLKAASEFEIRLGDGVLDQLGRPLEGARQFRFKTENEAIDRTGAGLVIHEPVDGSVRMVGGPGTADPDSAVILVNDTTGRTATVRSHADGSFDNSLEADEADLLRAVLVNRNGTTTSVRPSRQVFRDGSVGLFDAGGVVEAATENGPMQLIVAPGTVPNRVRYSLIAVSNSVLAAVLTTPPSGGAKIVGGFTLGVEGGEPDIAPDVAFPIDVAALGLPDGMKPEDATFALTVPRLAPDGTVAYEVIDRMVYENGRLITHSPPFTGANLRKLLDKKIRAKIESYIDQVRNTLGEKNAGLHGQFNKFVTHELMLPMMMFAGSHIRVRGTTTAARIERSALNGARAVPGSERALPGALVGADQGSVQQRPGYIRPGETFTTSDERGEYVFLLPVNLIGQAAGVVLRASHPDFFPIRAIDEGITIPDLEHSLAFTGLSGFIKRNLYFEIIDTQEALGPDSIPPTLGLAMNPVDPPPGTNSNAGVTVTVTARDDRGIRNLTVSVLNLAPLNPAITNVPPVPQPEGLILTNLSPTVMEARFRLKSPIRARVTVQARGTDASGNAAEATYPIVFAGDRIPAPASTNAPGPRLAAVWPPMNSTGVRLGTPVIMNFTMPLTNTAALDATNWLSVSGAQVSTVSLSADRKQATAYFRATPAAQVTFNVQPTLLGENGRPFDQDPKADGDQGTSFSLTMATSLESSLSGMTFGGGVVNKGSFSFALERTGNSDGELVVYDVSTATPTRVATLNLPGYPRDLALIPQYSYKLSENGAVATSDLLAVVGGAVSAEGFQYLWIIDVTQPLQPRRLAGTVATASIAALTKLKWSPPELSYLEAGADLTSVQFVNLQAFLLGKNATPAEIADWPQEGRDGVDKNHDGDYVDDGETVPLPTKTPLTFFGLDLSVTTGTTQRIEDFDTDGADGRISIVMRKGFERAADGLPDANKPLEGAYRTVYSGGRRLDAARSTLYFTNALPRRVAIFPHVLTERTNAAPTFLDLALVSLQRDSGSNTLAVVDITDPEKPASLGEVDLRLIGVPQSLARRADGLLALATFDDVLLIQPSKLLLPGAAAAGVLPGLVGTLPGMGSGVRSYEVPATGVNVVAAGGKHEVLRTPPTLRWVQFTNRDPFVASNAVTWATATKLQLLREAAEPARLIKTRLLDTTSTNVPLPLRPQDPATAYYVRVDALVNQQWLELNVDVLNNVGLPLPAGGSNAVPVRLGPKATLEPLGITNSIYPLRLRARRLSDDPGSVLYTVFLAGPIIVTDAVLVNNQVKSLQAELPRTVLRAGHSAWVGLDPAVTGPTLPTNWLSHVESGRLLPGAATAIPIEHRRNPVIFIPGMAGSYLDDAGDSTEYWLGYALDARHQKLELGSTNATAITPSDATRWAIRQAQLFSIYGKMLEYLTNQVGLVEYDYRVGDFKDWESHRTTTNALTGQIANSPNLFVYPYDWRKDNAEATAKLKEYIRVVRLLDPEAERVDIVAHSNGGLVARRFVLENPGLVGRCVTLGTPWLGAPKAVPTLLWGDADDFVMNIVIEPDRLAKLAGRFPGIHQLLPSKAYYDVGGTPFAERGWSVNGNRTRYESLGYSDYKQFIESLMSCVSAPMATNEAFHGFSNDLGSQDDFRNDSSGVEFFHIYGIQSQPRTIEQVHAIHRLRPARLKGNDLRALLPWEITNEKDVALHTQATNVYDGDARFQLTRELTYVRGFGDGTVPTLSATRSGPVGNYGGNARFFPFTSAGPATDKDVEHNGMLNNPEVQALVAQLLSFPTEPPAASAASSSARIAIVRIANAKSGTTKVTYQSESDEPQALPTSNPGVGDNGMVARFIQKFLSWLVDDVAGRREEEFALFNTTGGTHRIEFEARPDEPLQVEARVLDGTNTVRFSAWRVPDPAGASGTVQVNWSTNGVDLKLANTTVDPAVMSTDSEANDAAPATIEVNYPDPHDRDLSEESRATLTILAKDVATPADKLKIYLGYDVDDDGLPWTDLYRPVRSNLVKAVQGKLSLEIDIEDIETKELNVLVEDRSGNVGFFKLHEATQKDLTDAEKLAKKCRELAEEKQLLQAAIARALQAVNASDWVVAANADLPDVAPGVQSILEQGSGGCFWEPGTWCEKCGDFTPKSSDHDFEVFLPMYSVFSSGPPPGFLNNPYAPSVITGDWYFKPPTAAGGGVAYSKPAAGGVETVSVGSADGKLIYNLPAGEQFTIKYAGPGSPMPTPANWISVIMTQVASNHLANAGQRAVAASLSFFCVRHELFVNGLVDLELPFPVGGDPLGDAGMGRQALMQKWLLEGNYVDGVAGLPANPTPLAEILTKFQALGSSVPVAEAYEWGVYQKFAALGSGLLLRPVGAAGNAVPVAPAHDYFYGLTKGQIKKAGKSAIRATLGALAVDDPSVFATSRIAYRTNHFRSFEHFVSEIAAARANQPGVFPNLPGGQRVTPDQFREFYLGKVGDRQLVKRLMADEDALNAYLARCVWFCHAMTLQGGKYYQAYTNYLETVPPDEKAARVRNLNAVRSGFPELKKPGLDTLESTIFLNLPIQVINDGPAAANGTRMEFKFGSNQEQRTVNVAPDGRLEVKGSFEKHEQFHVEEPYNPNGAAKQAWVVVFPPNGYRESNTNNNWFGFQYYPLNYFVPSPPRPSLQPLPAPVPLPPGDPTATFDFEFRHCRP